MKARLYSTLLLLVFTTGCASQLAVKEMAIEPATISLGKRGLIKVTFVGPKKSVASVHATVYEAPEIFYDLSDDGTNGDEKADDNVWTARVDVPYEAQPGIYHLDIRARDAEGNTIAVKGGELTGAGYSGSITVTVN